jgi:hypothetical protein
MILMLSNYSSSPVATQQGQNIDIPQQVRLYLLTWRTGSFVTCRGFLTPVYLHFTNPVFAL